MSNYFLHTPQDIAQQVANKVKSLRIQQNWTQSTLSKRAGVSLGSLRRFEQKGEISLHSLLLLVSALGRLDDFSAILTPLPATSLDELEKQHKRHTRKRGRI